MYYIITLSTGQPLILYQENEKIYLYAIANGRIYSKQLLFNDYKENLIILNNQFIFYQTISNKAKFFRITHGVTKKLFDLPFNTKVLAQSQDVFIFYTINNSLYCIKCSSYNKSTLLLKNIIHFNAIIYNDFILLETDTTFYKLSSDMKLSELEYNPNMILNLQTEITKKDNEISSLKFSQKTLFEQCNTLENKIGRLQEELRKYRYIK